MPGKATIVGNWKMNKTIGETINFVSTLKDMSYYCRVGLAVPFTMIQAASQAAIGTKIMIGAQNVAAEPKGAFTGEISSVMIKDAGASFAIIGHSERRKLFYEDNVSVDKKAKLLLSDGIIPLICIGESHEEHKRGETENVLRIQLLECLNGISIDAAANLMIAYEPIWAIGTGQAASPESVQKVHAYCRKILEGKWEETIASNIAILYGGSVNPENAHQLIDLKDVDGLLVGGASLSIETFSKILSSTLYNF